MPLGADVGSTSREESIAHPFAVEPAVAPYFQSSGWGQRLVAALLLLPGVPFILALAALVRLTSRGPAIYRQQRVGRRGRTFWMYKLRTMRHNAETDTGPVWALESDPRVTPLGRVLRAMHADELPQLVNVLRGEMALVGPRPERPEFVQVLSREIPHYVHRLAVLPGVTGLAQVNFGPDADLDCVRRKLILDLEYIRTADAVLDLRIIVRTLLRLFAIRGVLANRLLGLDRVREVREALARMKESQGELRDAASADSATHTEGERPLAPRAVAAGSDGNGFAGSHLDPLGDQATDSSRTQSEAAGSVLSRRPATLVAAGSPHANGTPVDIHPDGGPDGSPSSNGSGSSRRGRGMEEPAPLRRAR